MRANLRVHMLVFLGTALSVATPAFAQRDLEIPIQFDFINAGARSLALGGAFIGLADDATAAATNPAGLQRLARPEVSVEGRGWQFITSYVQGGRLSGSITNIGIDRFSDPVFAETKERAGGLAFLSFVYPRGKWSFAGYRQEASRLQSDAETQGAFFVERDSSGVLRNGREYPARVERTIDVVNYGASVARRAGKVSIGGGIVFSQSSFESTLVGYDVPGFTEQLFFAPATYAQPIYSNDQSSDEIGVGYVGGLQIVPDDHFQLGVSYRRGARFDFEGSLQYPAFPTLSGNYSGEFKVPDNVGAGVAVRLRDNVTIAADLNRVFYSQLQDFVQAQVRFRPSDSHLYGIDDATEFHLGGEVVVTKWRTNPALRAGYWHESDHSLQYAGQDELYQAIQTLSGSINHFSFGAGIAATQRFEMNAGFDFSDRANTMSFSAIVRF